MAQIGNRFVTFATLVLLIASSFLANGGDFSNNEMLQQGLLVQIKTDKRAYAVGERIRFTATLRNNGSTGVYISKSFSDAGGGIAGFYVTVTQLTGKPSGQGCVATGDKGWGESRTPEQILREDYFLLPPGGFVGFETEFTGCVVKNSGLYQAQATYSAQDVNIEKVRQVAGNPYHVAIGQIQSGLIKFRVR